MRSNIAGHLYGLGAVATEIHDVPLNPCPPQYQVAILWAFTQLGMLPE
jgi:hypothetical protein